MKGYFYLSILALLFTPAVGVGQILECRGEQATCQSNPPYQIGRCPVEKVYCEKMGNKAPDNCHFICKVCKEKNDEKRLDSLRDGCLREQSYIIFAIAGGDEMYSFEDGNNLKRKLKECCTQMRNRAEEQDNRDFTSY